jgi:hypothetical protein
VNHDAVWATTSDAILDHYLAATAQVGSTASAG